MVGDKISPNLSEQITVHKSACLIHLDIDSKDDWNIHVQQQDAELQDQVLNNLLPHTAPIVVLHTPVATNRLTAIGGVIIPIEVFTIMIRPSAIGLTPSAVAIGSRIGVTRRMMDCVSKEASQEQKQQVHYEQDDKLVGEDCHDRSGQDRRNVLSGHKPAKRCGHGYDEHTAELTQESAKILYSVFRFTSLNTNTEMISA